MSQCHTFQQAFAQLFTLRELLFVECDIDIENKNLLISLYYPVTFHL